MIQVPRKLIVGNVTDGDYSNNQYWQTIHLQKEVYTICASSK